jgi:hypothetical protein
LVKDVGLHNAEGFVSIFDALSIEADETLGSKELFVPLEEANVHWLEFGDDLLIGKAGDVGCRVQLVDFLNETSSKGRVREVDYELLDLVDILLISCEPHHDLFSGLHLQVGPVSPVNSEGLPNLGSSSDVLLGAILLLSGNAEVVNEVREVLPDPRVVLSGNGKISVVIVSLSTDEVFSNDSSDSVAN